MITGNESFQIVYATVSIVVCSNYDDNSIIILSALKFGKKLMVERSELSLIETVSVCI